MGQGLSFFAGASSTFATVFPTPLATASPATFAIASPPFSQRLFQCHSEPLFQCLLQRFSQHSRQRFPRNVSQQRLPQSLTASARNNPAWPLPCGHSTGFPGCFPGGLEPESGLDPGHVLCCFKTALHHCNLSLHLLICQQYYLRL